jgi:hypothetical protein
MLVPDCNPMMIIFNTRTPDLEGKRIRGQALSPVMPLGTCLLRQTSERTTLGPLLSTTLPARAGPQLRTVPSPSFFIITVS